MSEGKREPSRLKVIRGHRESPPGPTRRFVLVPGQRVLSSDDLEWYWVTRSEVVELDVDSVMRVPMDWEVELEGEMDD